MKKLFNKITIIKQKDKFVTSSTYSIKNNF